MAVAQSWDPEQVMRMSPDALKSRLTTPHNNEKSKLSLWTCGTARGEPSAADNSVNIDGFYTSKSYAVDESNLISQYASSSSVKQVNKGSRSTSRYHLSRADEWEASKNLRHLLTKNVNFLSPSDARDNSSKRVRRYGGDEQHFSNSFHNPSIYERRGTAVKAAPSQLHRGLEQDMRSMQQRSVSAQKE